MAAPKKPGKYRNVKVEFDGHTFDSKAERDRYLVLIHDLAHGRIHSLEVHPTFPLIVHEQTIGSYSGDFAYVVTATGERIVEDVKSPRTAKLAMFRRNLKLMWALYGITVREVMT